MDSPLPRLGKENNEFWVRVLIPAEPKRASDGKVASVMLMVNGLAESDVSTYDDVAESLADLGIASIFLPLPNHFCRNVPEADQASAYDMKGSDPFVLSPDGPEGNGGKKVQGRLLKRMGSGPELWIDGFEQSLEDIFHLVDSVRGEERSAHPFFGDHFSAHTKISLYGYSLGGLIVLCAVLARAWLFRAAFIVNSGCSLEEVNGAKLFGKEDWKQVQLGILRAYQQRLANDVPVRFADEFEQVMLGNWQRLRHERLERLCHRILFINGANDEVFNIESVMRVGSKEIGIALLQLPLIGHMIASSSRAEWKLWRAFLASLLATFERERPADSGVDETIETTLRELHRRGPGERIRIKYMRLENDALVPDTVSPNTAGSPDARMTMPRGTGLCWQAISYEEGVPATADLRNLDDLKRLNYSEDQLAILRAANLGYAVALPVYPPAVGEGARQALGALAIASDRGEDATILTGNGSVADMQACAALVGQFTAGQTRARNRFAKER